MRPLGAGILPPTLTCLLADNRKVIAQEDVGSGGNWKEDGFCFICFFFLFKVMERLAQCSGCQYLLLIRVKEERVHGGVISGGQAFCLLSSFQCFTSKSFRDLVKVLEAVQKNKMSAFAEEKAAGKGC